MAGDLQLPVQFDYQNTRELAAEFKAYFNIRFSPPAVLLGERRPVK
jgi:hypothetical protein